MQLVTVRFDQVFDVVHAMHQRRQTTLFSFQHGEQKHFGVRMPGTLHPRPGMVVTACLRKSGDWTSLAGWFDHASGNTVTASAGPELMFLLMSVLIATSLFIRGRPGEPVTWVVLTLLVVGMVMTAHALYVLRQVRSALSSCTAR